MQVVYNNYWVLMEYECMGPKLTQAEGFVLGVGAKMFTIAGPVIVYGTVASVIYGIIYWITTLFWHKRLDQIGQAFFLCYYRVNNPIENEQKYTDKK